MKVTPVGYKLLIRPDKVEEKSKGGIIVSSPTMKKMEEIAQVIGTVLEIGELCWDKHGAPWAKVGDRVLYQRHSGMRVPDGKGGFVEDLLILNDLDITAVVTDEGNDNASA